MADGDTGFDTPKLTDGIAVADGMFAGKPGGAEQGTALKERARQHYAQSNGLELSEVTLRMVEEDPKGLIWWAFDGQGGTNARSPVGQACRRACMANPEINEVYRWLPQPLQQQFRDGWAMTRSFEFMRESRKIESWSDKRSKKKSHGRR